MRKKSLVSMVCVLLLALATSVPALATPRNTDGVGPQVGVFSLVLDWLAGLVATPSSPGPDAIRAAANGYGSAGGDATDGAVTATCEICPGGEGRASVDPNG